MNCPQSSGSEERLKSLQVLVEIFLRHAKFTKEKL